MLTLLQRFFRRTGLLADVARIAALAALAMLLAVGVNAVRPAGLPLWPAAGQRPAVPLAIWQKIQFADAATVGSRDGALLVDVREPHDYEVGHPPGAVNLPYREFSSAFPDFRNTVKPTTPLFVYCYGSECGTSVRIANRLIQGGFTDVTIVRGGFEAWHEHGAEGDGGEAAGA